MKGYFFLGSILPTLQFGSPTDWSFADLMTLYKVNLSKQGMKKVKVIRSYIDLKNVCQLLRKEPLDPRGNLSEKELDEALVNRQGLPSYLYDHLEAYETLEQQIRYFPTVLSTFFQEMRDKYRGFLRFYFNFERELRLILTGLRAKKLKVDVAKELLFEDPRDPFIAQILAQKDSPQFEFPFEYAMLDEVLKEASKDPMEQYKALATFRFQQIADEVQDQPFSLDYILGYLVQFMLVEDWNHLNEEQGNHRLNGIVKEVG